MIKKVVKYVGHEIKENTELAEYRQQSINAKSRANLFLDFI